MVDSYASVCHLPGQGTKKPTSSVGSASRWWAVLCRLVRVYQVRSTRSLPDCSGGVLSMLLDDSVAVVFDGVDDLAGFLSVVSGDELGGEVVVAP